MRGFIEVRGHYGYRKLLNVSHIEEVREQYDGNCTIYMAFNCPGSTEQDYFEVNQSYDEIVALIEKAVRYEV